MPNANVYATSATGVYTDHLISTDPNFWTIANPAQDASHRVRLRILVGTESKNGHCRCNRCYHPPEPGIDSAG